MLNRVLLKGTAEKVDFLKDATAGASPQLTKPTNCSAGGESKDHRASFSPRTCGETDTAWKTFPYIGIQPPSRCEEKAEHGLCVVMKTNLYEVGWVGFLLTTEQKKCILRV